MGNNIIQTAIGIVAVGASHTHFNSMNGQRITNYDSADDYDNDDDNQHNGFSITNSGRTQNKLFRPIEIDSSAAAIYINSKRHQSINNSSSSSEQYKTIRTQNTLRNQGGGNPFRLN